MSILPKAFAAVVTTTAAVVAALSVAGPATAVSVVGHTPQYTSGARLASADRNASARIAAAQPATSVDLRVSKSPAPVTLPSSTPSIRPAWAQTDTQNTRRAVMTHQEECRSTFLM